MWKYIILFIVTIYELFSADNTIDDRLIDTRINEKAHPLECVKTINELLIMSFNKHPSIKMSLEGFKNADAQVQAAKWNYFPNPTVGYSRNSGRTETTLSLSQPLWTGGKLDATYEGAVSQRKTSEFAIEEERYTLYQTLLGVLQNYMQAKGEIVALEEGIIQLNSLKTMLDHRIDAGASSVADKELIKSKLAQSKADLAVAKSKLTTSYSQLELLLGEKFECSIDFEEKNILAQNESIEQIIDSMVKTNPSLKSLSTQIETAKSEIKKAKSMLWPSVSLQVSRQAGSMYYDSEVVNTSTYVTVQMSPGAGLSSLSNIESAEAKVLQLQYQKLAKQQELSNSIINYYNEYHTASERTYGTIETIDSSEKVFESFMRLFLAGKRQWLDLVNTSKDLIQYKVTLANLRSTRIITAYRLALAKGEIKYIQEGKE